MVPFVVKVGARRRRSAASVKVVQQGGEAKGGVGGVGQRATGGGGGGVAVFFPVEVAEGGAARLREERASGHRRGRRISLFLQVISLSFSLSVDDETLSDTSVLLLFALEEKEARGQKRQRQAESWVGEEKKKAPTMMPSSSATEKTLNFFFRLVFLLLLLFFFFTGREPPARPSLSIPSLSPLHPQHLLQPLQLQLPVRDRMLDRLGGSSRVFLSLSSSSSFASASAALGSLKLGPYRRGELRAGRAASSVAPSAAWSPRGHSKERPVQVERLGAQQKVLEVEGRRSRSTRARRHRGGGSS